MDPKHYLIGDKRTQGACVFCGREPDTKDHVPSKVFLDGPFPDQLPTVDACNKCNQGFSSDEEYLATLLEVVLSGSTDPAKMKRSKIKRAISQNTRLRDSLEACYRVDENGVATWLPESERVKNVVAKLARGHVAYELSFSVIEAPTSVIFQPLITMSDEDRDRFESAGSGGLRGWPEIGSRAFLRSVGAKPYTDTNGPWIDVQPERYRYSVDYNGSVNVRIVIADYLACEILWEWCDE